MQNDKLNPLLILTLLLTLIASGSYGQEGTIKGRVYNESNNESIPFANIIIFGTTIGSTSDLDGNFIFTGISPGFVSLAVSAVGYEARVTEDFMVTNAKVAFVNIPMTPKEFELQEVVIKASPFARTAESPVSLQTLQISEIEKTPGGNRDISKVIQILPGVASGVAYRNDVIVRGGGASENSFYLDEVEIPNLNHFSTQGASGGPVGIINADFIREVQLYSGAFPADKGRTLSSTLDMKLIDGNQEEILFRGSIGASDLALTLNGPIGEKSTFLFSYRRSYLQFLFSALGLPFLPTYNDFLGKYKVRLDNKNELSFIGLGSIDKFRLNDGIENPTDDQQYILSYLPTNNQWSYTVGATYKHFHAKGFTTLVLSRNMLSNQSYKYLENVEADSLKTYDYSSQEAENKLRAEYVSRAGRYRYSFGGGLELARYTNETFQSFVTDGTYDPLIYSTQIRIYQWNLFGEVSRGFFGDRLTLALGLRFDANDYDSQMSNLLRQASPRFSASYALSEKWSVNFNTGRYHQRPPFTSMGYRNNAGELVNRNNSISYITADHVVGGLQFLPAFDAKITLEGFYKNYDNYPFSVRDSINLASKGADFGTFGDEEIMSISKGKAYGFEVLFQDKSLLGFNILMSYTFVRSEFTDKNGEYLPSIWDNQNIFNLTVLRTFKKSWDAGIKWRFVGGGPYTPADLVFSSFRPAWDIRGREYPDYSRFNQERLGPFHQLDIRVEKAFFFDKWSLSLYVDIQNVYNFKADEAPKYTNLDKSGDPDIINPDAPYGQQYYNLRMIETSSGTILPTLGIIVEI